MKYDQAFVFSSALHIHGKSSRLLDVVLLNTFDRVVPFKGHRFYDSLYLSMQHSSHSFPIRIIRGNNPLLFPITFVEHVLTSTNRLHQRLHADVRRLVFTINKNG